MIKKIYFDLDATLVDFAKGIKELGFVLDPKKDKAKEDNRMWEMIKPIEHFYKYLDPLPGAIDMYKQIVKEYGEENVEILTGIPKPHRGIQNASEDKIWWVRKYLSKTIKVNIVLRADKPKFCKGCEYILIDDNLSNCKDWVKGGGMAIQYQSPEDTFEKLTQIKTMV